jgi:hypothetical protein
MAFQVPERWRVTAGRLASDKAMGNNGLFLLPLTGGATVRVIASDGMGWEHVSASLPDRCPTWPEMCAVKSAFWSPDDCVMQYHPPEADYVNCHPYCLHLWRPVGGDLPRPPAILVGWR